MDQDTFTGTLVDWIEYERTQAHSITVPHLGSEAYRRLEAAGTDVLPYVNRAYGSSVSDYYWLFDDRDASAFASIRAFGFPRLVRAVDPDFAIPERFWGDVIGCTAYTRSWLEDRVSAQRRSSASSARNTLPKIQAAP